MAFLIVPCVTRQDVVVLSWYRLLPLPYIQCECRKVNTSFERHCFPLLFIADDVTDTVAIEHLTKCMPNSDLRDDGHVRPNLPRVSISERRNEIPVLYLLEVEGNDAQCLNIGCAFKINGRIAISNAEILQCHTFTKCIICVVVLPGYAIGDLCPPPRKLSGASLLWSWRRQW